MGWLKASAKQQRWLSKLNGNIDKSITLTSDEVKALLLSKFESVV